MTEKEYIVGLKRNDKFVFSQFVKKYQERIVRICYAYIHNMGDAEDIAQEVFIEIFKSVNKFKGDSKLFTWIYRIAVNKSLNYLRDNQRKNKILRIENFSNQSLRIQDNSGEDYGQSQDRKNLKKIVFLAIDNLPSNQKTAFLLNKYENLSYKEIAEVMDISLSSVESLIFRAKKKLKSVLILE